MKEHFRGYYRPTNEEFDALWDKALFVPDASALLNLYTYSIQTRDEFLKLISTLGRAWLPHQAAAEYHRNRCETIVKETERYKKILDQFQRIREELRARTRHPFIDSQLLDEIEELSERVKLALQTGRDEHHALLRDDPICAELTCIYAGNVGAPPTDEWLKEIQKEGETRYEKQIPPGYEDKKKEVTKRYGDLILWYQLIDKAKSSHNDVIFITDDAKDAWWHKVGDDRLGPRPELLQEFYAKTGQEIYIYSSDNFANRARDRGQVLSEKAVAEVKAASAERARNNSALLDVLAKFQSDFNKVQKSERLTEHLLDRLFEPSHRQADKLSKMADWKMLIDEAVKQKIEQYSQDSGLLMNYDPVDKSEQNEKHEGAE